MLNTIVALCILAPLSMMALGVAPPSWVRDLLGPPLVPDVSGLLIGVVAGLIVAAKAHRWIDRLDTLIHEFGHSLVAVLFAGRVHWVVLHRQGGGRMASSGRGRVAVSLAGYVAPAVVAGALFLATSHGLVREWLIYMAAILAVGTVMKMRNAHGWLVAAVSVTAMGAAAYAVDRQILAVIGFALAAALGVSSLRSARRHVHVARAGGDCDAVNVAAVWPVPGAAVAVGQVLVCLGVLMLAAWQTMRLIA